MNGRLSRISTGDNSGKTRTEDIVGKFDYPPAVGERFAITGPPINPLASARLWLTSEVKSVVALDTGFNFETESGSSYELLVED